MAIKYAVIIILNSLLMVIGQTFMKIAMNLDQTLSIKTFLNYRILLGLCIYIITALVWLSLLPKVDFSVAYPLNSTAYIFSIFASFLFLGESITVTKVIGTIIIIIGIIIIVH